MYASTKRLVALTSKAHRADRHGSLHAEVTLALACAGLERD